MFNVCPNKYSVSRVAPRHLTRPFSPQPRSCASEEGRVTAEGRRATANIERFAHWHCDLASLCGAESMLPRLCLDIRRRCVYNASVTCASTLIRFQIRRRSRAGRAPLGPRSQICSLAFWAPVGCRLGVGVARVRLWLIGLAPSASPVCCNQRCISSDSWAAFRRLRRARSDTCPT